MKAFFITFTALLLLSSMPMSAYAAWDGVISGKIAQIDVTAAENAGFRVVLEGTPTLCGNSNTWAYINKSNDNYEVYVSAMLSAKFAGSLVIIYMNQATNGHCVIGYISVR